MKNTIPRLLVIGSLLSLAPPAMADWAGRGNIVASGPGTDQTGYRADDHDSPMASDGSGGCFVGYILAGGTSIHLNHLRGGTGDGRLWGTDGVEVNPGGTAAAGAAGRPHLLADGGGGCWVLWEDRRSGGSGIWVQRFGAGGVPISSEEGGRFTIGLPGSASPVIAPGAEASRLLFAFVQNGQTRVGRLRIQGNGFLSPLELNAQMSTTAGSTPVQLFSDGANGGILVWATATDIRANRFDNTGAKQWGNDGVLIQSNTNIVVKSPQALWDGTNLFVAWTPFTNQNPGFPLLPNALPQGIRAQKLDGNGALLWGTTPVTVMNRVDNPESNYLSASQDEELRSHIASDGSGGLWLGWVDSRDFTLPVPSEGNSQHAQDLFVQRLNAAGVRQLAANGAAVDAHSGTSRGIQVAPGLDGDLLIAYKSLILPNETGDIVGMRISSAGTPDPGFFLNRIPGDPNDNQQLNPQVLSDGSGGMFVAWDDQRVTTNQDVYVTHRTGAMGLESPPPALVTDQISLSVPEQGTGTFGVRLTDPPSANITVTVSRSSGDTDVTVQNGGTLTFTPQNWNVFQTVTVAAAQDLDSINGVATIRSSATGFTNANVRVTEVDAGPPHISINNIGVSVFSGGARTVAFTVSLDHASDAPTTVHFATRDGTAEAQGLFNVGQYFVTSGTLTIQPNTLSSNISVRVTGFGGGTFFMDLSNPGNGTIVDGTGQCTIRIIDLIGPGVFELSPDNIRIAAGETVNYSVVWTVPEGEVWRNLATIDFRIRKGNQTAIWVHWDELANTFRICDITGKHDSTIVCTPERSPGSPFVLESPSAQLLLAQTTVVGSGPTGPSVTLSLAIRFNNTAPGHYKIELAASDDLGHQDDFTEAGDLQIGPIHSDESDQNLNE